MKKVKNEYLPVSMVSYEIGLAGAILTASTDVQGNINDYNYQEEDNC